mgnify:CR=1 FL=1
MNEEAERADAPDPRPLSGRARAEISALRRAIRRSRHAMDLARQQGDRERELIHLCELDSLRARLKKIDLEDDGPTTLIPSPPPEGAVCTVIGTSTRQGLRVEQPQGPRTSPIVERKDPRNLAAKARRHRVLKGRHEGQ